MQFFQRSRGSLWFFTLGLLTIITAASAGAQSTENAETATAATVSQNDVARAADATDIKCKVRPVQIGHGARAPGQPNADAAVDAPECQVKGGVRQQIPAGNQLGAQMSSQGSNGAALAAPFLTTTNQNMTNFGGPLIKSGTSHNIYLNCALTPASLCWGNPYGFQVDLFASNFMKIVDQYIGSTAPNRYTQDGTAITITASLLATISDTNIRTLVASAMRVRFPSGGGGGYSNVYNIFLPQGQEICLSLSNCYSPSSPSSFTMCGYHSIANMTDAAGVRTPVVYNVIPYAAVPGCQVPAGSPNGQLADSINNLLSHELIEAITDPDGSTGWFYNGITNNGLFFPEIADMCVGDLQAVTLNTRPYLIQSEYSNATGGCVTTPPVPAVMASPLSGTPLTALTQTFSWAASTPAAQYWLSVGSTAGGTDFFNQSTGAALSANVTGLPNDGRLLYVTLWTNFAGAWLSTTSTYTAAMIAPVKATMTSPANGATLTGTSQAFQWNTGAAALGYWLSVGTTVGGSDIFDQSAGAATTLTVNNLPINAQTVYVRLYTKFWTGWQFSDTTNVAFTSPRAVINAPAPGSVLPDASATFQWAAVAGANKYWLTVGKSAGDGSIYNATTNSGTSATVANLPGDGSTIYTRLWTQVGSTWLMYDQTFTAFDARAVITTPASASTLSGATQTFSWSAGSGATQYWLSVGNTAGAGDIYSGSTGLATSKTVSGLPIDGRTIYTRLWTQVGTTWLMYDQTFTAFDGRAVMTAPVNASTLTGAAQSFTWSAGSGAAQYWLSVGNTAGAGDIYSGSTGLATNKTVSGLPVDGRALYVRLWTQVGTTWYQNSYSYTAANIPPVKAVMQSPADAATLTYGGTTPVLTWTTGAAVSSYWLSVGTSVGDGSIYSQSTGSNTSANVPGIPFDGRTIFVRLWSLINGGWQSTDSTFVAGDARAAISSPVNGAVVGSSATFTWPAVTGAQQYWVSVGTSAGAGNIFDQTTGTAPTATVASIPAGRPLYVRLWTRLEGVWLFKDATYQ